MMTICYSYLLLLIIHWTNTASVRSSSKWPLDRRHSAFIITNESTTLEPVLSRRRPLLPAGERRRRWTKDKDNDEVEIPINETLIEQWTTTEYDNIYSNENSTNISTLFDVKYPLLRQDVVEIDQTDESTLQNNSSDTNLFSSTTSNEIIDINSTESEIFPTNVTDINQSITDNLTINNETVTSSFPISTNQTIEETSTISQTETTFEQDTAIIVFDYTTISPVATNDSIDLESTIISVNNTTITIETTDAVQNDTTVTDHEINDTTMISDISQNDTSTAMIDENEYSNETIEVLPKPAAKPICDRSCQCSKNCSNGFEIINDTCRCNPPCKNYQCFGNDTCSVTKEGKPLCQSTNGNRPIRCRQPRDAGYHDVNMRYDDRWYYDPDQDTCHLFVYRGLGGNENNFQTLNECHLECITCAPAPDRGTCQGYIRMWYYDAKKKQCLQFEYSGCKGNENKFLRKQDCIDTCVTRILNL